MSLSSLIVVHPAEAALVPPHGQIDLPEYGPITFSPPTLVDITGNGRQEILVGTSDGKVIAIEYTHGGSRLAKLWSFDTRPVMGGPTVIRGAISAGDLNEDGSPEIVVPLGDVFSTNTVGGIVVLDAQGQFLWNYFTQDHAGPHDVPDGLSDGVVSTPALGDLNNDGKLEIVFGGFDFRIHVLHHDGRVAKGWPKFIRDTVWSSPALADLNNNGFLEIIIGVDTHLEPAPFNTPDGGGLYVFNFDGTNVEGWPRFIDQVIYSSPAVGDLNGNGMLEIVHGTGEHYPNPEAGHKIYTWDAKGNLLWTGKTNGYVRSSPALGDLTGDGKLEVVANSMEDGKTYTWRHDGTQLWATRPLDYRGEWRPLSESPVIADYDGDGKADVFTNVFWEAAIIDGPTGRQLTGTSLTDSRPTYLSGNTAAGNSPALGDIDGDGKLELIVASANNAGTHAQVVFWDLSTPATPASAPWPMFGQNPQHTGLYPVDTPLHSRVVSHDLPSIVLPGERRQVAIVMQNTGTTTWQAGNVFLEAVGGVDPFTGLSQIPLSQNVAPGEEAIFHLDLAAPAAERYAVTDWRLADNGSGKPFGARVKVNIKIGNQPALYVLTSQGIQAGGLATVAMPSPSGYTNWPAAHAFKFTSDKRGYYLLDSFGGFWYGGDTFPLWPIEHRSNLQDFELGPNGIEYWVLLGDGTIVGCDVGPCHNTFSPPTPTGIAARSLALTPDGRGVYVVDGYGNIYNGGAAPVFAPPAGLPAAEDIIVRIKLTKDGKGYYLLDRYGRVWNGGAAPALSPKYTFQLGQDWAVDFELTEDETGYYMLAKEGSIHAGGSADELTVNLPPLGSGNYARDLELVDSRRAEPPVLDASPASATAVMVEQGNTGSLLFKLNISNSGSIPLTWEGTARWKAGAGLPDITLSPSGGTLNASAEQTVHVAVSHLNDQPNGTYPLEVEVSGTAGDQNLLRRLAFSVVVVDSVYHVHLPAIVR